MKRFVVVIFLLTLGIVSCDNATEPTGQANQQSDLDKLFAHLNQPENSIAIAVIDKNGDTTFFLKQAEYQKSVNWAKYSDRALDRYISIEYSGDNPGLEIYLKDATGLGQYGLDSGKQSARRATYRNVLGNRFEQRSGSVTITEFDTLTHKLSATIDAIMLTWGSQQPDTLHVLARFKSIELSTLRDLMSSRIMWGDSVFYSGNNAYLTSSNTLELSGSRTYTYVCERDRTVQRSFIVKMTIPSPAQRVYTTSEAKWAYADVWDGSPGTNCAGPDRFADPDANDALTITKFDPVSRRISGSFTIGGSRAEFTDLTWRRYP